MPDAPSKTPPSGDWIATAATVLRMVGRTVWRLVYRLKLGQKKT